MSAARPAPRIVPKVGLATPTSTATGPAAETPEKGASRSLPPESPAARVAEHFHRLRSRIGDCTRRVHARADDDAIHDLRVATRRVIALLRLWRGVFPRGARRDALRDLKSLRGRLGRAREFEVHAALLREHLDQVAGVERPLALTLLVSFERRRERRRRSIARHAGRAEVRPVRRLLKRGIGRVHRDGSLPNEAIARAEMRIATRERRARELVAAAAAHDDTALHEARLAIKRWRYAAECGARAVASAERLRAAQKLQGVLGEIHDRATLIAAVREEQPTLVALRVMLEAERAALRRSLPARIAQAFPEATAVGTSTSEAKIPATTDERETP